MRYWPFYGERWLAKTSHLSMTQEGAYLRLCIWMMMHQAPLPADERAVLRIARANNASQEKAARFVLAFYFSLGDGPGGYGYHQKTADEILLWYEQRGGLAREMLDVESVRARVSSLRERRAVYVKALQAQGVSVASHIGIQAVRELAEKLGVTVPEDALRVTRNGKSNADVTPSVTGELKKNKVNTVTAPAGGGHNGVTDPAPAPPGTEGKPSENPEQPGPMALALKAIEHGGMAGAYPTPRLMRLVDAGITPEEFQAAAAEATARGKGFAWMLAMVDGRKREATQAVDAPPGAANGPRRRDQPDARALEGERLALALVAQGKDPWDPHNWPPPSAVKGDNSNGINDLPAI